MMSSGESVPILKYQVHDAMQNNDMILDPSCSGSGNLHSNQLQHVGSSMDYLGAQQADAHDLLQLPELPDFTQRPKTLLTNGLFPDSNEGMDQAYSNSTFDANSPYRYQPETDRHSAFGEDLSPQRPFYSVQTSGTQSKNASGAFFSDALTDEHTYNELPLNEILDDFQYEDEDNYNTLKIDEESDVEGHSLNGDYPISRAETPDIHYQYLGKDINRSESPFLKKKEPEYVTEIPSFYSANLKYPYKSPLDYTDEEFDKMNHFEFLKDLKFEPPPLLPVYLNSNLLNDSNSKNYKTFPYQYQESTVPHVNEIYRYRINDLNLMDKYSAHKPSRPLLKRSGSSNSSCSSTSIHRSNKNGGKILSKLLRENSNSSTKSNSRLKHADKMQLIERNLVPHHVMLNHLVTCNFNKEGYITSSCITRYKGKFITQIMYFSNELDQL